MEIKYDKLLDHEREKDILKDMQFIRNGNTAELWWMGQKVQSWTYVPPTLTGQPFGAWLGLWRTYS